MALRHSNPDDQTPLTLKFLYSYAGKILPRYPDCKLRYIGGQTRILSVNRSVTFSELSSKFRDLCGFTAITFKCQLPNEDLDALVSVKSDEDLANIIDVYDRSSSSSKIKAFISPLKPKISAGKSVLAVGIRSVPGVLACRCVHEMSSPMRFPAKFGRSAGNLCFSAFLIPRNMYLAHSRNQWL